MIVADILTALFVLAGTVLMILGAVGMLRFGDVFMRMHAATKASVLGIGFIMIGVAIHFSDPLVIFKLLTLAMIYFFTAPTGTHVLARGAHVARIPMARETRVDELAESHHTDVDAENAEEQAAT